MRAENENGALYYHSPLSRNERVCQSDGCCYVYRRSQTEWCEKRKNNNSTKTPLLVADLGLFPKGRGDIFHSRTKKIVLIAMTMFS